jgi:DNA repair protein RecN (Recombination protein N)
MLCEIRIQNFAIIDKLDIRLAPGFNVITGETGAGKSIIIDAVELLLGGKADPGFVRAGNDKATIEGIFKLPEHAQAEVRTALEEEGIELEAPDEVILTREIRSNGRSTCRINGSTVSIQFMKQIGGDLVDIHGQSEHLSLLNPKEHIELLDRYAELEVPRMKLADVVSELVTVRHEIGQLLQDEAALARRMDMLKYQIEEIRAVNPKVDEEESLKEESTRLSNSEQLSTLTAEALAALDSNDASDGMAALDLLNAAASALGKLARIDSSLAEAHADAESLAEDVRDLARLLWSYHERVEHNPKRLNEVEDRLDALTRLKRKYGGTVEAVLNYYEKAQKDLNDISNSEERIAELRVREEKLLREIGKQAQAVSAKRAAAAQKLGAGIVEELNDLRMEGARFEVSLQQHDDPEGCYVGDRRLAFDATGIDDVEFLMAANRGEPLRPMAKVASGGETARIMLALKGVLSRADRTPTLIFDEIDQGIGGRVGATVGQKLWSLSEDHQVLCVTHLAQLAGFGDSHFKVAKGYRGDRTVTSVTPLNDKARVEELAEMLGAETMSAKQSAHDILMLARQVKEGRGIQPALL